MDLDPGLLSAAGVLLTALTGFAAWYFKRRDSRSAAVSAIRVEEAGLEDAAVSRMDRVATMIETRLLAEIGRLGVRIEEQTAMISSLQDADRDKGRELGRITQRVAHLESTIEGPVGEVIDWIESGANPPSPERQIAILRELIHELRQRRPHRKP